MTIYRGPGGAGDATNDAIVNEVASYATSAASSAANAATSATTASTASSSAGTSAINATNSATAAATSASNAATSASSASSSATTATAKANEAATSATQAANKASAASDSEANALNSANTAANKANDAANSATAAATSVTNATAQTTAAASSATAAANSATAAATSATNSATSATASAASATSAATQATNSATSATDSAASATTALSYLNTFKGQYYGNLATNPTVDPLGNAIGQGDLYWNTTENTMKVFDGVSWIVVTTGANSAVKTQEFTATSGQTTFTVTGGYLVGQIFVFKNGLKLASSAYTATDGSTFVLGSGATAGDILFALVFTKALISQPPFYSASSDEFTSATAYDQTVKMNINGKPYYMNNVAVAPTVDFKFGTTKNLQNAADGQVPATFTRASAATYFDASGVMQSAASGTARFTHDPSASNASLGLLVEPQRTNLVTASAAYDQQNLFAYSNTFDNAAWTKTRATVTSGQSDPFGGTAAYKLAEDTATNTHFVSQAATTVSGFTHVVSFYAKAAERNWVALTYSTAAAALIFFDLQNGVVGTSSGTSSPTNGTITSVGNGWYRCSCVITTSSTAGTWFLQVATANGTQSYTGTTGSGIYIYGAQLERSYITAPTPYYATTSAAWNPWTAVQTTLTPSAGTAPDGTNSAYKVVAVSGQTLNTSANYLRSAVLSTTNGSSYTVSVYAKASGYNGLGLRLSSATGLSAGLVCQTRFNLSNGSVTSVSIGSNATITSVGNGWYRCSITGVAAGATYYAGFWNDDSSATTADGTSGILLWGFQVEQADSVSTYIPTTTSQVTRAADVLSLADSGWLNQTEGTFYVDRKLRATNDNQTLFSLDNGTSDVEVRTIKGTNTTNLLTYTEQLENPVWTKSGTTLTPKAITGPDGLLSGALLTETTSSAGHGLVYTAGSLGNTYTTSVYLKSYSGNRWVQIYSTSNNARVNFDLVNGTIAVQAGCNASITSVGNGWYRCVYTPTDTSHTNWVIQFATTATAIRAPSYTGDGTSGVYVWGPQFELASSASAYEPNPKYLTSYEIGSDGLIQTANYSSIDLPNAYQKSTFGYKANDATYYRGGSSVGTDTSVTLPTVMNRLIVGGSAISSGREINGTIKRLTYWPLKLTNTSQTTITS